MGELHKTVTEDDYEDEDKELTQTFPISKVTWQHLSLQLCTA
jgi:hypothetical protein